MYSSPLTYAKSGSHNIALVAPDYLPGGTVVEKFKNYLQKPGGQIAAEVYWWRDTQDSGRYRQWSLQTAANADAVWAWFIGADVIRFMTQYQEFGLED